MFMVMVEVIVRDHKAKTNHLHKLFGFDLQHMLKMAKWDFDEWYPNGYTITLLK